jgi:hypothetical protein
VSPSITPTPSISITPSVTATPSITPSITPSRSAIPVLSLIANVDCANQILAVTASGGTSPYEFSKDGGVTWTSGSSNPYQFTSVSGILDPWVKDADGSLFRYDRIDCGELSVTFEPIYLNANAVGAILAPDSNSYRYVYGMHIEKS